MTWESWRKFTKVSVNGNPKLVTSPEPHDQLYKSLGNTGKKKDEKLGKNLKQIISSNQRKIKIVANLNWSIPI